MWYSFDPPAKLSFRDNLDSTLAIELRNRDPSGVSESTTSGSVSLRIASPNRSPISKCARVLITRLPYFLAMHAYTVFRATRISCGASIDASLDKSRSNAPVHALVLVLV